MPVMAVDKYSPFLNAICWLNVTELFKLHVTDEKATSQTMKLPCVLKQFIVYYQIWRGSYMH